MARRDKRNQEAERELLLAQAAAARAQPGQGTAELAAKERLALAQLASDQSINASKLGLGREEVQGRDRQGQLAAALEALGQQSKAQVARESDRSAVAQDLARRTDIPQSVLATALAESGQPGLYNALEKENVNKRETAINTLLPALTSAKSDEDRVKNIKPSLEALGPGTYDIALARAFPKPENESVRGPLKPQRFQAPTEATTGGVDFSGLASTLLGKAGVTPQNDVASAPVTPTGYPILPNTPENRTLGQSALQGSTPVAGGIRTPSGGFIGGDLSPDRLAKLINPGAASVSSRTAAAQSTPAIDIPLVPPPAFDFGPLLANNEGAVAPTTAPTPVAAPVVAPTATPVPQATPQLTPDALALLKQRQAAAALGY